MDCTADYIIFYVDNTIHTKIVQCFPNNTAWITSDLSPHFVSALGKGLAEIIIILVYSFLYSNQSS